MSPELVTGLSTIASLVIIEGLLSVDNVLGIASLAKELPEQDRKRAIRLGMLGAYIFRLIALFAASWLLANTYVRWLGAGYLVYLMCSHLSKAAAAEESGKTLANASFGMILMQISLMDLTLSIDNVITAVSLAPKGVMWPIYVGVTISIFALQLLAPMAIRLLDKYPILSPTAFVLLGFVGGILMVEEGFHVHVHPGEKFACIAVIIGVAMLYSSRPGVKAALSPLFKICRIPMGPLTALVEGVFWPLKFLFKKALPKA